MTHIGVARRMFDRPCGAVERPLVCRRDSARQGVSQRIHHEVVGLASTSCQSFERESQCMAERPDSWLETVSLAANDSPNKRIVPAAKPIAMSLKSQRITAPLFTAFKAEGRKISMVNAYD